MVMAGGSGTRLWPMSRKSLPKQLIPFIEGKSLLEIALDRLDGLIPTEQCLVCASEAHADVIQKAIPTIGTDQFLGEPCGRDTLNAVGLSAAVIFNRDPDAVMAVFTADHVIRPVKEFQQIVQSAFELVEQNEKTLLTFGITPTEPSTAYGYLELGEHISNKGFIVNCFREKPNAETATQFFRKGPDHYLWNSGMFVWRVADVMECIQRYHPSNYAGLVKIAEAWDTPQRSRILNDIYPTLEKISVDFAIMEPASQDADINVAAIPMPLQWLDVGSWPSFARTCNMDENENAVSANKTLLMDTRDTLVASSDPEHLITTIGCDDLVIIHTDKSTLVCRKDRTEDVKTLHQQIGERFGEDWL
ncbi:MAG: mannose-1-phosphate guanylyltransferase [Kiritimatiellae bacterium]|nr:mannose-1-phosphate guanylyltransferase [Kiritimatiellia bacterium]